MAKNRALQAAARAQQDEFYTQTGDIERELGYYWEHFYGKKILCNCDDPFESKFFEYFATRFHLPLRLAKLTATCYAGSPIAQQQISLFEEDRPAPLRTPYCATLTELRDFNGDGRTDMNDAIWAMKNIPGALRKLKGDGDFRSPECLELLEDADVVVTNPPFSLFREYVSLLVKHSKKFLILGNKNAVTYKEIFPLFMKGKIWLGYRGMNQDLWLKVPEGREHEREKKDGTKLKHIMACWFTNLEIKKRNEMFYLCKKYTPEKYPKYDNYDAIEVSRVDDIPCDYDGVMGVPVTFMDKYCPQQFEIVGCTESEGKGFSNGLWDASSGVAQPLINGRRIYKRLFIRKIAEFRWHL